MRRFAVFFLVVAIGLTSCIGGEQTPIDTREYNPGIRTIWRSYDDGNDRWTGKTIVLALEPGEYTTHDGNLAWCARTNSDPPSILFDIRVPKDAKALTVRGVCRGKVIRKDKSWYIQFTDCQFR